MEERFQGELLQGEKLLWTGQPGRSLFTAVDVLLVPFSLMWGGFALFWEATVLGYGFGNMKFKAGMSVPLIFPLFGGAFVLAGLYFIAGRFIYKSWRTSRTFYAVTNQRVLVLTETSTRQLRAAFIHQLPVIDKKIKADGSGTLTFGNSSGLGALVAMYENTGMDFFAGFYGAGPLSFHSVPDAQRIYTLVAEQQKAP